MNLTPAIVFATLALAAAGFNALCLIAAAIFARRPQPAATTLPPISILKPLKGCDPEMYSAFCTHCRQTYPEFEIVFGVNSADDEAVPYVHQLRAEFPRIPISLVVCEEALGTNRKMSNLVQMSRVAKHPLLVMNDSDISVPPDYLERVAAWLVRDEVGMVTCLYRARATNCFWAKVEALGISADFMPGALTALLLEGNARFGLGSTMAVKRSSLARMQGLETLVDHLADDYELGSRIADAGMQVAVPSLVVETSLPEYGFRDFWQHQLRWGRTVRSSRPAGYFGLFVTFGLFWAALMLLFAPMAWWAWCIAGLVVITRLAVLAYVSLGVVGDREVWRNLFALPVRDLVTPLVWLLSFFGNTIVWRGERFRLRHGKLYRSL